jgi:hypothetical protein
LEKQKEALILEKLKEKLNRQERKRQRREIKAGTVYQ